VEASAERPFERRSIEGDTQVPSPGDNAVVGGEKLGSQCKRVADADAQGDVQLPGERQPDEREVGNSSSDPSAIRADFREGKMGEQVVEPLVWCVDYK
jgi:hypothetical protein